MNDSINNREYIIPEGTASIRELEFAGREGLERLVIPDSVLKIGNYAFMNCYSLQEIRMPARIERIGAGLFQHCWKLGGIVIPEGVTMIGGEMFEGCHALSVLALPRTLRKVDRSAFSGCRSLREIIIDPEQLQILPPAARYKAVLTYMERNADIGDEGRPAGDNGGAQEFRHSEEIIDDYVRSRQANLLDLAINRRSTDAVRYMLSRELIGPDVLSEYLSKSAERSRVEITALMLEYGNRFRNDGGKRAGGRSLLDDDPFL